MAVGIAGGILGVCASWSAMNEDDGADDYNMGYEFSPIFSSNSKFRCYCTVFLHNV